MTLSKSPKSPEPIFAQLNQRPSPRHQIPMKPSVCPTLAPDAPDENEPSALEAIERLLAELTRDAGPSCYGRAAPRRAGVKLFGLLWLMRPDAMPWAPGVPQSAAMVATHLRVNRSSFCRVAVQMRAELGLRNSFTSHDWRAR